MFLSPLEASLNRNIAASSAARALCARLNGKALAIEIVGLPWPLRLTCTEERIHLGRDTDAPADARLAGSAIGLLNLAGARPDMAVSGGSVRIVGDADVAQSFRELLKLARPELEEELSRHIGDVPAHWLGNLAKDLAGFGKRAADTLAMNIGEYLQEEGRDVPTRVELDEFTAGVEALNKAVTRIDERLAQLENRLQRPPR